ncbi:alpha/beta fold hydrolase [Roseibium denhamense]|uniref:Alpha/beta hydrolase family protein n=1 Tax=Roseibium denhamense TaxID=76305 RepID=A0ABY1P2U4_9HYPH|nr:alpha/beta fold hydrolase [Roseibium denhamense]MTI07689.1 alpha/beta fold hydrolase [Roseibium denhamense]SMP24635.1 Alpha/beta hydrolase family protein [Roseibium denhamense]
MTAILKFASGLVFLFFFSAVHASEPWTVKSVPDQAGLYPGEEMLLTNGIETLNYFKAGDPEKPLVIFVPGGFHLARVAYGYPGGNERDFLAHWLGERGYSFLGSSYPTGNKVYSKAYPAFSIRDWGKQVAAVAKHYIDQHKLSGKVIVLGWSAGGQIAQSVYEASQAAGLDMSLYVSIASTPPIPLLLAAPGAISKASNGLSRAPQFYDLFKKYVVAQDQLNGHEIMPWPTFEADVLGDIPVALNAIMIASRYENGEFVEDLNWSLADTGGLKVTDFPFVVTISGNKVLDNDHALTDRGNWGLYQVQHLYRNLVLPVLSKSEDISPAAWQSLMDRISYATSGALNARVPGNHFFWYGEVGARETVQQMDILILRANNLRSDIRESLSSVSKD